MKLKAWRQARGLTQKDLADRIEVGAPAVSRYENGRVPEPDVMSKIWELTGGAVGPADFYGLGASAPPADREAAP